MQAIGSAVDNIHSLDENLAPLLVELGRVHGESAMFDASYFKLFKVTQSQLSNFCQSTSDPTKWTSVQQKLLPPLNYQLWSKCL